MSIAQLDFRPLRLRMALLLVALGAAPLALHAAAAAAPPNFIVIHVDDLGWSDLACQGSKFYETPHIDRLAATGIRFTDGYAACAVCSPTRAALLTGRYPARVGVTDWIRARFQGGAVPADGKNPSGYVGGNRKLLCPANPLWMEHEEVTIAEALHAAGYVSCHIGKWHLGPDDWYPERQGFDFNFGGCDYGQPPSYHDPFTNKRLPGGIPTLKPRSTGEYLSDREGDEAVGFIRKQAKKPFFLYYAPYAVHTPIQAKQPLLAKYEAKPKTNQKNAAYATMVESVDEQVGKLLDLLDELKLSERTFVLFTSDNGGLLGPTHNGPLRSGKGFPYEGGIRVPAIVRWPGVTQPGTTSDVPVISCDWLPTILAAAGVALPEGRPIDGIDLRPALEKHVLAGKEGTGRRALFWHFPHYRGGLGPYSIIRDGDWKLIRRWDGDTRELYNLADDLSETTNLAEQNPDKVRQLDARLDRWLANSGAKLPKPNPDYKPKPAGKQKGAKRPKKKKPAPAGK